MEVIAIASAQISLFPDPLFFFISLALRVSASFP
jgi:hypothetical protein